MEYFDSIKLEELENSCDEFMDKFGSYGTFESNSIEKIILDKSDNEENLEIWYKIVFSSAELSVKTIYSNVSCLILNPDSYSYFPSGRIHHIYNSTWEKEHRYHVFDVGDPPDVTDTVSFYCESFEIISIQSEKRLGV